MDKKPHFVASGMLFYYFNGILLNKEKEIVCNELNSVLHFCLNMCY